MSGQTYGRCCQTVHADIRVAREPAQVVRPRYSARVLGRMEFFRLSISREFRDEPAMDEVAATIGRQRYESIRIIAAKRSGWLWRRAAVDCRIYEAGRKQIAVYAERVHLKREARAWRVVMVELIAAQTRHTPGRNAPCPCGSGKKYKRCCGDHAEALTDWTA